MLDYIAKHKKWRQGQSSQKPSNPVHQFTKKFFEELIKCVRPKPDQPPNICLNADQKKKINKNINICMNMAFCKRNSYEELCSVDPEEKKKATHVIHLGQNKKLYFCDIYKCVREELRLLCLPLNPIGYRSPVCGDEEVIVMVPPNEERVVNVCEKEGFPFQIMNDVNDRSAPSIMNDVNDRSAPPIMNDVNDRSARSDFEGIIIYWYPRQINTEIRSTRRLSIAGRDWLDSGDNVRIAGPPPNALALYDEADAKATANTRTRAKEEANIKVALLDRPPPEKVESEEKFLEFVVKYPNSRIITTIHLKETDDKIVAHSGPSPTNGYFENLMKTFKNFDYCDVALPEEMFSINNYKIDGELHIEDVYIFGDGMGRVVHCAYHEDQVRRKKEGDHKCTCDGEKHIQHQMSPDARKAMVEDAIKFAEKEKYKDVGTIQFLIDKSGCHFFYKIRPTIDQVTNVGSKRINREKKKK
eukprot:g3737.t1